LLEHSKSLEKINTKNVDHINRLKHDAKPNISWIMRQNGGLEVNVSRAQGTSVENATTGQSGRTGPDV